MTVLMTLTKGYGFKKVFAILLIIISVSILTIIGFTSAAYNTSIIDPTLQYPSSNNNNKNIDQCAHSHSLRVKMFDQEIMPKYIIGKNYKVIPVNPRTTDVLLNACTLAPQQGISQ